MKNFLNLSKSLSYWELCFIEDALRAYEKSHPLEDSEEQRKAKELFETVQAARGWVHQVGKTQR